MSQPRNQGRSDGSNGWSSRENSYDDDDADEYRGGYRQGQVDRRDEEENERRRQDEDNNETPNAGSSTFNSSKGTTPAGSQDKGKDASKSGVVEVLDSTEKCLRAVDCFLESIKRLF